MEVRFKLNLEGGAELTLTEQKQNMIVLSKGNNEGKTYMGGSVSFLNKIRVYRMLIVK